MLQAQERERERESDLGKTCFLSLGISSPIHLAEEEEEEEEASIHISMLSIPSAFATLKKPFFSFEKLTARTYICIRTVYFTVSVLCCVRTYSMLYIYVL